MSAGLLFTRMISAVSAATFGTRAHGDSHIGPGECWSVIDPVAGHGHEFTLFLKFLNFFQFLIREDLREIRIQVEAFADCPGDFFIVPGHYAGLPFFQFPGESV